jgi:hypothetical protein
MSVSFTNIWMVRESGAAALAVIAAAVIAARVWSTRHRPWSRRALDITQRAFTRSLMQQGVDAEVSATTFHYLSEVQDVRFPILPGDTLDWDLGLDPERVQNTVGALAARLDRRVERTRQLPVTVEDLARMLQGLPHRGEVAAA